MYFSNDGKAVARASDDNTRRIEWRPLFRAGGLRVALLALGGDIPMHDHPRTRGLLVVLRGVVQVVTCKRLTTPVRGRLARLEVLSNRRLFPGGISVLGPNHGDIHSIRVLTHSCVLLDGLLHGRRDIDRNWYFPVDPGEDAGSQILARALLRPYLSRRHRRRGATQP